jgi:hypothetical protein
MRLPLSAQNEHPWLVCELAPDFTLDEVWEFPIHADASRGETFRLFCKLEDDASAEKLPGLAQWLVQLRLLLGKLGIDRSSHQLPIPGCQETSVRARMKAEDLGPVMEPAGQFPFRMVYDRENERLLEFSNGTVHGLLHLSWVARDKNFHSPRMAVYVKPRGWFGRLYMALIYPFRVLVVYPAVIRTSANRWNRRKLAQS